MAKIRVTPDLNERIPLVNDPDQVSAVVALLRNAADEDTVRNEAMNLLRRSNFVGLAEILLEVLDQPGERERFRSFVVQHLGHELEDGKPKDDDAHIRKRLRLAMCETQVAVRREAILALARVKDPEVETVINRGLFDPAYSDMRDLMVRLLLERDRRDAIPAVRTLGNDPDEGTRIAAIHALGSWRDQASRPILETARGTNHERTRRAAAAALRELDGITISPLR